MQPVDVLLSEAVQFVNAAQPERAWRLCEQALSRHPPHPGIHQLLALLALQQDRFALAHQHAAASLLLRPDHLPTLVLQVDAARAAGLVSTLAPALERIVVLDASRIEAWFQLAVLRQDALDFVGAQDALRQVLRLDPLRVDARMNLGMVLQALHLMPQALASYGQAYRLQPSCFGRIAHALASASSGSLWLSLEALRADLLRAPELA